MSPRNVKILLRSFSSVFPYTYTFAAEDLSSDVIMVASNHPLELDLAHLRRAFADQKLAAELKRGGVSSAEDLVAYLLLVPEEMPAFTAGAPINTDDNALIEYAAPRDLLGTFHYDPYLARVYGTDWPYGRFEKHLVNLGAGPDLVASELKLSYALLAHGRRIQSARFLAKALSDGTPSVPAHAVHGIRVDGQLFPEGMQTLYDALDMRKTSEFEEALGTPAADDPLGIGSLEPAHAGRSVRPGEAERIKHDAEELSRRARSGAYAHGLLLLKDWSESMVAEAGPDFSLLVGVLLYKSALYTEAVDRLKPLLADDAYVKRRPALLYYLARAEYGDAIYDAAVRNMERYFELKDSTALAAVHPAPGE